MNEAKFGRRCRSEGVALTAAKVINRNCPPSPTAIKARCFLHFVTSESCILLQAKMYTTDFILGKV